MEVLESTYPFLSIAGLCALVAALAVARMITPLERRLVSSAALMLAGIFFVARHGAATPSAEIVGAVTWLLGLAAFTDGALSWCSRDASRAGPLAVVFLLPPAFFGAVLLAGLAVSLLAL